MRHSDDKQEIRLIHEQYAIRKTRDATTLDWLLINGKFLGIGRNPDDGLIQGLQETPSQSRHSSLIKANRAENVALGFGIMDNPFHLPVG